MGATTTWERWDSMLPDGSINPGDMTSFNHYALGAVADYLHRVVGGLAPLAPGYRTFAVAPRPGGGLSHLLGSGHDTPYGLRGGSTGAVCEGCLHLTVDVPVGTTAVLCLPGSNDEPPVDTRRVGPGTHRVSVPFRDPQDDPPRPLHVDRVAAAFAAASRPNASVQGVLIERGLSDQPTV